MAVEGDVDDGVGGAGAGPGQALGWRLPATLPAATAGGVSLGLGLAGPAIGTVCSGLLASLPVVSVTVAMAQHTTCGPAAARQFLHGTVAGLVGRVAFGAVFAAVVPDVGGMQALGLALCTAVAVNLAAAKVLARRAAPGVASRSGNSVALSPTRDSAGG